MQIGCANWMAEESFSGPTVADPAWKGLDNACLTDATGAVTSNGVLGSCSSTTGVPTPTFSPGPGQRPGYLQLTDDSTNKVGAVLYDRAVPSKNGLVVEFTQYQFGEAASTNNSLSDRGADGIGFFLSDGAYTLSTSGAGGGALGYANKPSVPGLAHGYLGTGFDTYGNYAASSNDIATQCPGAVGTQMPNAVTLRGPGNGSTGYCAVGETMDLTALGIANGQAAGYSLRAKRATTGSTANQRIRDALAASERKTRITVYPLDGVNPGPKVQVEMDFGAGYVTVLTRQMQQPVPEMIKFGFLGSTGGSRDAHLLGAMSVGTVLPLETLNLQKLVDRREGSPDKDTVSWSVGQDVHYQFVVNNTGINPVYRVSVSDPQISNVSCPGDGVIPAGGQIVCTGTYKVTEVDRTNLHFLNTATATGSTSPASGGPLNLTSSDSEDVPINPNANDATRYIVPGATATFQVVDYGATAGLVLPEDPAKVKIQLIDPSTNLPTDATTITVAAQGTWKLDTTTNKVTFKPVNATYSGTVTPIKYKATSKVETNGVAGSAQGTLKVIISKTPLAVCTADQQRASDRYWGFGTNAKLDFGISGTSLPTPGQLSPVASNASGTFTVTDARGNLQFVVDSGLQRIVNRDGEVMTHGGTASDKDDPIDFGNWGEGASPAAVFPLGQATGKYVVVTSSAKSNEDGYLTYRIIDMALNGGMGGLSGNELEFMGGGRASTAVTAVPNALGTGYWVLNPLRGLNTIVAYPFDNEGNLGTPVSTDIGNSSGVSSYRLGYDDIRFSRDMTQVATVSSNAEAAVAANRSRVRLMTFDAQSGKLFPADTGTFEQAMGTDEEALGLEPSVGYSLEFSDDGSRLYVSSIGVSGVYGKVQSATTGSAGSRALSTFGAPVSSVYWGGGGVVRLGADDRLYWAGNNNQILRYLENPSGEDAGWNTSSLDLASGTMSGRALTNTLSDCAIPARGFDVQKLGDGGTPVAGAEFNLYHDDSTGKASGTLVEPGFTPVSGQVGLVEITGLQPGVYWLRETKAPAGYSLLAKDVRVTVTEDGTVTASSTPITPQVKLVKNADGSFTFNITDTGASVLPFTGGSGMSLPLALGGAVLLLLAIAGVIWWRRRQTLSASPGDQIPLHGFVELDGNQPSFSRRGKHAK
ncbi:MAG: SpaA isopeptide-forming pilin-related protein [Scrofimicrobium sp.]